MLTVIGLLPATFGLNIDSPQTALHKLGQNRPEAAKLIEQYGDDQKLLGMAAANNSEKLLVPLKSIRAVSGAERIALRNDVYRVLA